MNRIVTIACLTLVATAGLVRFAEAKPKVAVLGLALKDDGSGIDERSANVARQLTDAMRKRAKSKTGPYTLASGGEKELVDAVLLAGCLDANAACMVKIGSSPDVDTDFLIYGKLEKQDKGFKVSLNLLDVKKEQIVNLLTESQTDTRADELDRWGKSLYKRLVGEDDTGAVVIKANVDSGKVFVDDEVKGTLVNGEARIQGLEPGSHKIRVESDGAEGVSKVEIEVGQTAELDVTMESSLPPPPPGGGGRPGGIWRKIFIGSAIATGIVGGIWAYSFYEYQFALDSNYPNSFCGKPQPPVNGVDNIPGTPDDNPLYNDDFQPSCNALSRTYIVGPITGATLALTLVSYYMGYIRPPKHTPTSSLGPRRRGEVFGRGLSFAPVLTPDGAGASLRFDW